jgi:RHS repeat-associated protein
MHVFTHSDSTPKRDGFFYVYVTNRSEARVNFDNMIISRWEPMVRVAYDYYPFGLTWNNPAEFETPEGIHDHAYQDKEYQWNEFGSGAGLALYDFHARMYDPATATWSVPDPAEQFSNPYLAMGNNPVIGVDPDGRIVFTAIAVGAVLGGYMGGVMANDHGNPLRWEDNPNTWIGIGAGLVIGAFGGFSLAASKGGVSFLGHTIAKSVGKNLFGGVVGGTINSVSYYDGPESFGWGTLGDFSAGFAGSFVGGFAENRISAFVVGGIFNMLNQLIQEAPSEDEGFYEAMQHLVAGGLSSSAGAYFGGAETGLKLFGPGKEFLNKTFNYGLQANAYDFAFSKKKDFTKRTVAEHLTIFAVSGLSYHATSFFGMGSQSELSRLNETVRIKARKFLGISMVALVDVGVQMVAKGEFRDLYTKQTMRNKLGIGMLKSLFYTMK